MKNIQDIQAVLARMVELLRAGGINDWSRALDTLCQEVAGDPNGTSAKIISMFGGIGSLNDLILYKDGQPLTRENGELDVLRSRLYALCHG